MTPNYKINTHMGQRGRLLPDDEPAQKEAARWSL